MVKISQIEMMMKPRRNSCISLGEWSACVDSCTARGQVYLLPTAARFLFDLQMRKRAMRMARPSINMEPKLARYLPPPSEMPLRSHPPKPAPPRDGDSSKSCRKESIGSEGSEGGEVVVHYTLAVSIASCLCRDRSPADSLLDRGLYTQWRKVGVREICRIGSCLVGFKCWAPRRGSCLLCLTAVERRSLSRAEQSERESTRLDVFTDGRQDRERRVVVEIARGRQSKTSRGSLLAGLALAHCTKWH